MPRHKLKAIKLLIIATEAVKLLPKMFKGRSKSLAVRVLNISISGSFIYSLDLCLEVGVVSDISLTIERSLCTMDPYVYLS